MSNATQKGTRLKNNVRNRLATTCKLFSGNIVQYTYWAILVVVSGLVFPWIFWLWYSERKSSFATEIVVLIGLVMSGLFFLAYCGLAVYYLMTRL
jgi:hypothetical protein